MTFLIGPMQHHIAGHKDLTENKDILKVDSDEVAISLTIGSHTATPLVQVGDHVKIGQLIGKREDKFYVPVFSSVSGEVVAIEKRMSARLAPAEHIIIKNDHQDEKVNFRDINFDATKEDLINYMKEIGLLGQGGAGFPSYLKYSTDKCETLIINAVECEPYITADICNVERNLEDFKDGVKVLFRISGAKKCYIGIKETHAETISKLKELFNGENGIEVKALKDVYPMGWERTLTYSILGKRYDKLPIEVGAIVTNATTAITLAQTIKTKTYVYERYVTVAGDHLRDPHNVLCRIGTPIRELFEACGGIEVSPAIILMGGPMMGTSVTKDEVTITPINNAVLVFDYKEEEKWACLRCGRCVEHCPSSLEPVSISEAYQYTDVDRLATLHVMDCVECGMCTYICPSKIDVTENIRRAKKLFALRGKK